MLSCLLRALALAGSARLLPTAWLPQTTLPRVSPSTGPPLVPQPPSGLSPSPHADSDAANAAHASICVCTAWGSNKRGGATTWYNEARHVPPPTPTIGTPSLQPPGPHCGQHEVALRANNATCASEPMPSCSHTCYDETDRRHNHQPITNPWVARRQPALGPTMSTVSTTTAAIAAYATHRRVASLLPHELVMWPAGTDSAQRIQRDGIHIHVEFLPAGGFEFERFDSPRQLR